MAEVAAAVGVVDTSINAASNALDLYNKVLDQVIPWATFEETVETLRKYQTDYSTTAGQIVGETTTLIMNSQDAYIDATRLVYEWCGLVIPLLQGYLQLLPTYSEASANGQKVILMQVLTKGIENMTSAQSSLAKSSASFNACAGKLSALTTQLKNDFDVKSDYFTGQVDKIRKEAYLGAMSGIVAGPFGLAIAYGIAAGVVEGKLIPELKAKCEEVQNAYNLLKTTIEKATRDITDVKQKLQKEIMTIGDMKVQTQETNLWVSMNGLMIKQLQDSANKLITMCQAYMKSHNSQLRG
jgi:hemolysin E